MKTIAIGQCYPWALKDAIQNGGILVHGTVTAPFSRPVHRYTHAWVERDGHVYDWQTMEAHHGGIYMGIGWPCREFYEMFKPKKITKFTSKQAVILWRRSGHAGPW